MKIDTEIDYSALSVDGLHPLPNLIILGAQKCGTTSLHNYINNHHDVYMSHLKEPALFRDFERIQRYYDRRMSTHFKSKRDYHENFVLKGYKGERFFGESTTHYTALKIAEDEKIPEIMATLIPNARFIYIMRNPFERLRSVYAHGIKMGDTDENIENFMSRRPQHVETTKYHAQISQFIRYFEREQFLLISFEEMVNDPIKTVRNVYNFLGLSCTLSDFPKSYIVYNKTAAHSSKLSGGIFSDRFYNCVISTFHAEVKALKEYGFYPDWDLSAERWVTEEGNYSLYLSLGHLGFIQKNDIAGFEEFVKQCTDKKNIISLKRDLFKLRVKSSWIGALLRGMIRSVRWVKRKIQHG